MSYLHPWVSFCTGRGPGFFSHLISAFFDLAPQTKVLYSVVLRAIQYHKLFAVLALNQIDT